MKYGFFRLALEYRKARGAELKFIKSIFASKGFWKQTYVLLLFYCGALLPFYQILVQSVQ